MVDNSCIIEGNVKFRDGKKWKSRWCVMRKLSPVADCMHLQLYGDSKDRFKNAHTKASLSLQHFLGVQSGFTLDKESNTIAIICRDIIVVLAFDTRERLIQWQVKISNNLGEDRQFLVLISTAASKGKISNGPAHLRVQNYRFCITVGIPPRLVGIWKIVHLRKYGVVDGRFCFEGGSRCDRGEGLHVLITDQGDEIVKTFQLAVEGKLPSRKKNGRDQASQESPRSQFSRSETRVSDCVPSASYVSNYHEKYYESSKNDSSSFWFSSDRHQEIESEENFSSRDSISTSEMTEQPNDWQRYSFSRQGSSKLERCASCIGKLGTISKSSTSVTTVEPSSGLQHSNLSHVTHRALDGLSLSSYSSSSHESDYSVSQRDGTFQQMECCCSQTKLEQTPPVCLPLKSPAVPPRPPKSRNEMTNAAKLKKPPMPLPNTAQICTCRQKNVVRKNDLSIGPYNNYDIPKPILVHRAIPSQAEPQNQYYDTPRKIKESLPNEYSNYDMPHLPQAVMLQRCGCPTKLSQSTRPSACPCQNVLSWAGFVLPYCRRGAGIEPTGVTVQPIRLSGEGKMPVVNANGGVNFFPENLSGFSHKEECDKNSQANYENIGTIIDTQPNANTPNYVNINFNSSNHYENSKDLILKTGISKNEWKQISTDLEMQKEGNKEKNVCSKKGEPDYLEVEAKKVCKNSSSSYLPMQPAHVCSKQMLSRLVSGVKSSSNPTLSSTSSAEGIKKRSDSEYRVPGPTVLSSPCFTRRLIDVNKNKESILLRKRSYSEEAARFVDEEKSNSTICDCTKDSSKKISLNAEDSVNKVEKAFLNQLSFQLSSTGSCIKIRRSSSVPSKAGHSRDSSSSNDSGVFTGSATNRNNEFLDFDYASVPTSTPLKRRQSTLLAKSARPGCFYNSLPRKSKTNDLLKEINFQFQKIKVPAKSSSAESDIPSKETKRFTNSDEIPINRCPDSRSTSSGTSDMSDYIETLSLSSHSSTETPDCLRHESRGIATTLRPRNGKEYCKIDRSILLDSERNANSALSNYANIASVEEKSESPSPGYMSSSPFERQSLTKEHFLFSKES
ncbi:uncharacterized protein LOC122499801 [Leptopilina heterotoma]|uniref:uncharacterized protein LOC122499801 n=1 Tax=Leptopilina heterotoma TaxID=63436 RepID=UPI001CA9AB1E|nr:uncharacterized protein LOC122499801 [Leptopilina heterotoma]